jgi:hypothetical protein
MPRFILFGRFGDFTFTKWDIRNPSVHKSAFDRRQLSFWGRTENDATVGDAPPS